MELPDIDVVARKVHEAWLENKLAQGVTSRKSETGEEMMVPYDELSEECKENDRVMVRVVYEAVREAMSEKDATGDDAS